MGLVTCEFERRLRVVYPRETHARNAFEQLQIRIAGTTAQVRHARRIASEQHLEEEASVKREVTRNHERLKDGSVRRAEVVEMPHAKHASSSGHAFAQKTRDGAVRGRGRTALAEPWGDCWRWWTLGARVGVCPPWFERASPPQCSPPLQRQ